MARIAFGLASIAMSLLAAVQQVRGVCSPGEMAVGTEFLEFFSGPAESFLVYSGFLMTTNCAIISQNDIDTNPNQMCSSGYFHGASVQCENNFPVSAVDTQGDFWTCHSTNDNSCDVGGTGGAFRVLACCDRQ